MELNSAVNTRAYVLMMSEYTRRLLERGPGWGRIINLSTDAAHAHVANVSYAASKHAIESYSRSAAAELGKYGITVNIVAPGPIQTEYITPEEESSIAAATPLRRIGRPEDVADVIAFLASEQENKISRQTWAIVPNIREVDALLCQDPELRARAHEVHPEVSFYFLAGKHPLHHSKKSKIGREERYARQGADWRQRWGDLDDAGHRHSCFVRR